jgi:hypothetical protein
MGELSEEAVDLLAQVRPGVSETMCREPVAVQPAPALLGRVEPWNGGWQPDGLDPEQRAQRPVGSSDWVGDSLAPGPDPAALPLPVAGAAAHPPSARALPMPRSRSRLRRELPCRWPVSPARPSVS